MRPDRFYVAPFSPDGELAGIGEWAIPDLSSKWIEVCTSMIATNPPWFDRTLGGPLDHIRFNFRWREGSARLQLYVHGVACVSAILLPGTAPSEEMSEIEKFLDEIRTTAAPILNPISEAPFGELAILQQRPLAGSVIWPLNISEQDQELIKELGWHFAAAFFLYLSEDA